jgi:hypothetical protein
VRAQAQALRALGLLAGGATVWVPVLYSVVW